MNAEYPPALWLPAHATNFRANARTGYTKIVIHVTDGRPNPIAVAEMWQTPKHGSSAHFVVGQDGQVIQAVRLGDAAFHAHALNQSSIGIEHCARSPGEFGKDDTGLPPSAPQLVASSKLCAWLCKRAGLSADRQTIVGHAEADPQTTHEDCPEGAGLVLDWYVPLVAAELALL